MNRALNCKKKKKVQKAVVFTQFNDLQGMSLLLKLLVDLKLCHFLHVTSKVLYYVDFHSISCVSGHKVQFCFSFKAHIRISAIY